MKAILCDLVGHRWKQVWRYLGPDMRRIFFGVQLPVGHKCTRCGKRK